MAKQHCTPSTSFLRNHHRDASRRGGSEEEREEVDVLLHKVGILAESYNNKLQIVEVMPVGLKNRIENIGLLKEAIYNHAANYKSVLVCTSWAEDPC